jgi:F0F1-type ATP synthase membrane subunit b/b'
MFHHLIEDPKFWLLICFVIFIVLMIVPFKKFLIGGLDNKIEEIKKNIQKSLKGYTVAEEELDKANQTTKDLTSKVNEILNDAKLQAEMMYKSIIEKNQNTVKSKEKNSIDRIKQIELATVQSIKSQTSIKLNEMLINYFKVMNTDKKNTILKEKVKDLRTVQ